MLQNLRNIFESNIKSLEILYILEDVKPAARIMVKEEDIVPNSSCKARTKDRIFGFFREEKLNYVISDFKVVKQDRDKAYSDKGVKVPIDSEEKGYFFAYVSKNKETAEKAKSLESNDQHKELGILLGYPECCAEFFEKNFSDESKRENDFTLASLKNSDGFQFPFYTNIGARHFDIALLNHFPCSFNCENSIELAKRHLGIIEKDNGEAAEIIKGMLKGAILYTSNGVFLLRYPRLEHNRLYYKGIMASKDNQFYESLKNAEYIEIVNKDRIRLDNLEIKNIGVMLFC